MVANAHEFPGIYGALGIDLNDLGCVMLGLDPIPVMHALGHDLSRDLFWHPDPKKWWVKGPVGETGAHVTLLYGILKRMFPPEGRYFQAVDEVLAGWEQPESIAIKEIVAWTPPDGGPYRTIVGKVAVSPAVREAHERLSLLPHVDTFLEYSPHVTLAYVRQEAADEAVTALQWELSTVVKTAHLDYGHP